MSDNNEEKKGLLKKLMDKLDFHKVEDENIDFKEIFKSQKNAKEKEEYRVRELRKDKDDPLSGRKILIDQVKNDEDDKGRIRRNYRKRKSKSSILKRINLKYIVFPIIAILFFVSIYFILTKVDGNSINRIENEFYTAMDKENIKKLRDLIYIEGESKEYYNQSIGNFVQLYKTDEKFKKFIKNSIETDVKNIKKNKEYISKNIVGVIKRNDEDSIVPGYKIKITPLKIHDDSIIDKNIVIGENVKDNVENLLVIPGVYKVRSNWEYLQLENEVVIKYTGDKTNFNLYVDYSKSKIINDNINIEEGDFVLNVYGAPDDALVFIDEKNTGMTVNEFNEFGNKKLTSENTIAVVKSNNVGCLASELVSLREVNNSVELPLDYNNDFYLDKFINIARKTLDEDEMAFRNSDINIFSTLGGEGLENAITWIKDNIGYERYYVRDYISYLIDIDSLDVRPTSAYIGGYLNYREGQYDKDETDIEMGLEEFTDKKVGFHFKYNEKDKKWYVDLWGTTYRYIGNENTILLKLE